jgi:hypothetical protein
VRLGIALTLAAILLAVPGARFQDPVWAGTSSVTNSGSEVAGFLHLQSYGNYAILPSVNAPGCGQPSIFGAGFEYWEIVWSSPCVDPGESVSFDLGPGTIFAHYWAVEPPVVSAVNDTGQDAVALTLNAYAYIKGFELVENAPGCPEPAYEYLSSSVLELTWPNACVGPGEKVSIHIGALSPVTTASLTWTAGAPVGGVAELPNARTQPLTEEQSSGKGLLFLAGMITAVAALALASGARYARRQLR